MMPHDLIPLPITEFEVHAVYGLHITVPPLTPDKNQWKSWFLKQQNKSNPLPQRASWTPIYRNHSGIVTLHLPACALPRIIKIHYPRLFCEFDANSKNTTPSFPIKLSHTLSVRQDGMSAMTVRLKAAKRKSKVSYDIADVLSAMLLAPRTQDGLKIERANIDPTAEVATTDPIFQMPKIADGNIDKRSLVDTLAATKVSPLYRMFLEGIRTFLAKHPYAQWDELWEDKINDQKMKGAIVGEKTLDLPPGVGDPQIPYFTVIISIPQLMYEKLFLETEDCKECKRDARRKYTQHLAAILGRWLTPDNAKYISYDYLEAQGLTRDDAFMNKYMNSLSFVTYSPSVTLCIRPERSFKRSQTILARPALNPQEATYGSILRCVELSRLRWHQALRLNHLLDDLIQRVIQHKGTERFDDFVAEVVHIRAETAKHLLNPLTYQWDATVGADIASFLHGDVVERVEEECIKKLNMVKQLLHEKLDVSRVRDMRKAFETTPPQSKKS